MTDTQQSPACDDPDAHERGNSRIDRRQLMRQVAILGGAVSAAGWVFTLDANAQSSPAAIPEGTPIRIGVTASASGANATTAQYMREAYLLWESEQNEAGGLLGRPVEMVIRDDESDPATAADVYEKLISEDKVDLVLGPYSTDVTLAVVPITEKHGMSLLSTGGSSLEIWESNPKAVFGVFSPAENYFKPIVLDIAPAQGYTTAAVIYGDATFSTATGRAAVALCQEAGIDVVLEEQYSRQETDFAPVLTRIGDANPDMIICGSYLADAVLILQQAKELDVQAKLIAFSVGAAVPDFVEALGADANDVLGPSMWEPAVATMGNPEFVAAYQERWSREPAYHSANGFAGCQILAQAVVAAGGLDHDLIRDQLRSMTMQTILPGEYKVDEAGRQIGHIVLTIQWQNGEKVIVAPENLKLGDIQLPFPAWSERS